MTKNELQKLIQSWESIDLVIKHVIEFPEHFEVLIRLAFDEQEERNWRAAWMIDRIHEKKPELVLPFLPAITEFVFTTKSSGKKRHFLKLISLHNTPQHKMAELLNYCFEIFTDKTEPVAVRVHAMQILFNIAMKEHDFAGELIDLIEQEMEYHGSAGISSRGKKLLGKLYQAKG